MPSRTQLVQYLRFGLEELTHRNGQFDFEALTQEVVRSRIASNIVTATGQVTAKGDQGRDAETYVSYLQRQLGPHTAFLAHVSDRMIAVCCTIQREGLEAKFVKDAKKVMASGAPIERIYAMCSLPVAVGVRHHIEAAAGAAAGVPVTLLDGKWLAEQLADDELLWIGRRYLELSEDILPFTDPSIDEIDEYVIVRDRWQVADTPRPMPGDFHEIRAGLRTAAEPGPRRADLPMWLNRMEQMLQLEISLALRVRVEYELAVAAVLGCRDLRPMDHHVRAYFEEVPGWDHPLRLHDASVLLMFLYGMVAAGQTSLLPGDLKTWHNELVAQLESLLKQSTGPTRLAYLRYILGSLRLHPDPDLIEMSPTPRDLPEIDVIRRAFAESGKLTSDKLLDPAGAIREWQALLDEQPSSGSLFPLELLANLVSLMTGVLIDVDGWDEMVGALDLALATASGKATAAAQAFARAEQLIELDRPLAAIRALHTAKVEWLGGGLLQEAFQALLALSDCYVRLRLPLAAKQYALAAAYLCVGTDRDEIRDLLPPALTEVARVEFVAGQWLASFRAAAAAINAFGQHNVLAEGMEPSEEVIFSVQVLGTVAAAARDISPELNSAIAPLVADENRVLEGFTEQHPPTDAQGWLNQGRELKLLDSPFGDAGADTAHRFSALGLSWKVSAANNDPRSRVAAERLTAAASVLSVELADIDLCLLPGDVQIGVSAVDTGRSSFDIETALPSEDNGWTWNIELGASRSWLDDAEAVVQELVGVLLAVVGERSLLPQERLTERVALAFRTGGFAHVFVASAYDTLVEHVFEGIPEVGTAAHVPWDRQAPSAHPDLGWRGGPGPTYSVGEAEKALISRYEKLLPPVHRTLPRLLASPTPRAALHRLRDEGWFDWHLLQAVHGIVVGYRAPEDAADWSREQVEAFALADESPDAVEVPLELFSYEALRSSLGAGALATLQVWGLELRSAHIDSDSVIVFLVARYAHKTDDVPHDDLFAGLAESPTA